MIGKKERDPDIYGTLEIKMPDDDWLRIARGSQEGTVYIGFTSSGESGCFDLNDFKEHVLKFYKEHF